MPLILLFLLLLILSFGLLLYFLKPSSMERAVAEQLANLEETEPARRDRSTILKQNAAGSNLIEDLAQRLPWSAAATRLIKQAGCDWSVGTVTAVSLALGLLTYWLASCFSDATLINAAIGGGAGVAPFLYLYILREVCFRKFSALLPEAVDLMSRGLRAGHSISAVLEMVGNEIAEPIGSQFRAVQGEQSLGLPIRESMANLVERVPINDLRFLATAILLQKESGGNLAQILDKTAVVIRERARLRGQLQIYTAQGRITGYILGTAPFLMFGLISLVNHQYEKTLFSDAFGLKMVYFGLGLMVIGILAIRKIIDVKV